MNDGCNISTTNAEADYAATTTQIPPTSNTLFSNVNMNDICNSFPNSISLSKDINVGKNAKNICKYSPEYRIGDYAASNHQHNTKQIKVITCNVIPIILNRKINHNQVTRTTSPSSVRTAANLVMIAHQMVDPLYSYSRPYISNHPLMYL